jgi:hypothetical protein
VVTQFPAAKAPTEQQKWVRAVERAVNTLETDISNAQNREVNSASSRAGTLGSLQAQVRGLAETTQELAVTTDFLASLITESTTGTDYLVDNIPGDQTNRWNAGTGDTEVTLNVATGRLLVVFGVSSLIVHSYDSTLYGMLRIVLTAPSGWTVTIGANTRVYVIANTYFGIPVSSERTIDDIPTDEPITVQVQFGTWSANTATLANVSFLSPFVRAEVVPA